MLRQYRDLTPGEQFVVFADTAAGGSDYCACQFLSVSKLDVPLVWHERVIASEMTAWLATFLPDLARLTGIKPLVSYERNNGGVFEIERLARLNREGLWSIYEQPGETRKLGWDTNSATRPQMLAALKEFIDGQLITLYDRPTIQELFSFVVVQTSSSWKAQAEKGAHDDLVMSLAGAIQLYLQSPLPIPVGGLNQVRAYVGGDSVTKTGASMVNPARSSVTATGYHPKASNQFRSFKR